VARLRVADLQHWLAGPDAQEAPPTGALVIDLDEPTPEPLDDRLIPLPYVVIGVGTGAPGCVDVVVTGSELETVLATVANAPIAAAALALLLRGAPGRGVADGLVAESTTYSMLQAGPEFAAWRAANPPRDRPPEDRSAVRTERVDNELRVTLTRPHVRNALDRRMRDDLVAALTIALLDPSVRVVLAGDGPDFCAGGDLDEFGQRADPASAHLVRLARSPALLLSRLSDRVTARLHGACYGSGIELPAFAGRVVAAPDTRIALPELALGLVPGAGGIVSLPRRIGRHRTAWLALTGTPIDAPTALAWGLVDAILQAGAPL
jgi:enoyl-CoA hydratase/carnithine racemase